MALRKLERRNYSGMWLASIKYQNLHSFKVGLILLCQSILETRRTTHLHGSAHFTIPLITSKQIHSYRKLNLPLTNSIYLVFLPLEIQRKLKETKVYHSFFSHCLKIAAPKTLFSSVYVIGKTCFD